MARPEVLLVLPLDVLQVSSKYAFGPREEKITEFGVQPFRGRKVKTPTGTPPTPQAAVVSASPVKSDR